MKKFVENKKDLPASHANDIVLPNDTSQTVEQLIIDIEQNLRKKGDTKNDNGLELRGLEGQLVWQYVRYNKEYQQDYDELEKNIDDIIKKHKDEDSEYLLYKMETSIDKLDFSFQHKWHVYNSVDYRKAILDCSASDFFNLASTYKIDYSTLKMFFEPTYGETLFSRQAEKNNTSNLIKHAVTPLLLIINPAFPREKILDQVNKILIKQPAELYKIQNRINKIKNKIKNKRSRRDLLEYFLCYYFREEEKFSYKKVHAKLESLTGKKVRFRIDKISDKIKNFKEISDISPWYFIFS